MKAQIRRTTESPGWYFHHQRPMLVTGTPLAWMQGEGTEVRPEVGAADDGALAAGQRRVQVLAAADLHQLPQGPGPAPQPHQVDNFAAADTEDVPGQTLGVVGAECLAEHLPQAVHDLGVLLRPVPEGPVAPPAGGTVRKAGREQGNQRRNHEVVGDGLRWAYQPPYRCHHLTPGQLRGPFFPVPGAEVCADGVHGVEVLRDEVHVVHHDAEPLLDEDHQPQQAQ